MGRKERIAIIQEIQEKRKSKVFCYLTSDRPNAEVQMKKDILPIFVQQLRHLNIKSSLKIDIFMFTHGGDTLAAFGLSRLLREYSDYVSVLIPDCSHSAGTLFALGANEIIMTKGATLSPIDPSITRPLNPAIQLNKNQQSQIIALSVESVAGYQGLIDKEWKGSNKSELYKILAEKVHPLALGDVYRVRQQINHLATQLLLQHRSDKRAIHRIVKILSKDLGSHDYLIYLNEAKKLLGNQVRQDPLIMDLIWELYHEYASEMSLGSPFDPNVLLNQANNQSITAELKLAIIESESELNIAKRIEKLSRYIIPQQNGVQIQGIKQETIFSGWDSEA